MLLACTLAVLSMLPLAASQEEVARMVVDPGGEVRVGAGGILRVGLVAGGSSAAASDPASPPPPHIPPQSPPLAPAGAPLTPIAACQGRSIFADGCNADNVNTYSALADLWCQAMGASTGLSWIEVHSNLTISEQFELCYMASGTTPSYHWSFGCQGNCFCLTDLVCN